MVAIRRDQQPRSLGGLPSRLAIILGAVVCGMGLSSMTKSFSTSTYSDEIIVSTASSSSLYSSPGLRSNPFGSQCRYYLAESAIPNGGLGIFTAVGVQPDTVLNVDQCIYVHDAPRFKGFQLRTHSYGRSTFFGQFEGHNSRAACEGLATLMNTMPNTAITAKLVSPTRADNAGLDRRTSPGAGAITQYYGIKTVSVDIIPAGSEITHDYGDWDFDPKHDYIKPMRPPEWLHENGFCIDNIDILPATDPQMGRGAFSTRYLSQGTMVAPAPLQVYPRRKDFTYKGREALIVNYCFQAKGSDLLFFPYGPAVNLINHSRKKANVFLRWSQQRIAHPQWLDLPLKEFWEMTYPGGIVLEVVALRNIKPGEELFMDYGNDWEEAWNEHVRAWKPPSTSAGEYAYPGDADETALLRTMKEQKTHPYPANIGFMCNTPDWDRERTNSVVWSEPQWSWGLEGYIRCHVMERTKGDHGDDVYTVSLIFDHSHEFDPRIEMKDRYLDYKVPRRAIRTVDKPYASDEHLPGVFRHPLELPDSLFPAQWNEA